MASSNQPGLDDGGSMRHRLPQIPSMPGASRLAVSKASLKQYPESIKPFANLVSMEELEGKEREEDEARTPTKSPDEGHPESGASPELLSEPSPQSEKEDSTPVATPPTSPIKLKIRRSMEKGKSKLTSTLQEDEEIDRSTAEEGEEPEVFGVIRKGIKPKPKKPRKAKTKIESDEPSSTVNAETASVLTSPPKKKRGRKSKSKPNEEDDVPTSTSDAPAAENVVTENPQEVQRATTFVPEKKPELSLSHPPKWLVGDIVWAKVSGHPWWACMVSYDPLLGAYVREVGSNKIREYHVQFFGDLPERGWIKEPSTREFQGLDEFEDWREKMIAANKRDKSKYEIAVRKRQGWSIAVAAAEGALPRSRNERRQLYTFLYEPPKSMQSSKASSTPNGVVRRGVKPPKQVKRKKKSLVSESETTGAEESESEPPKKRQKRGSVSKPDKLNLAASPTHKPTELSPSQVKASNKLANKEVAQFMVFCQKRRDQVREENPDFGDLQIEQMLQQVWTEMDQDDRSRFIPMGSDVQHLSEMLPDDQAVIGSFSSDGGKRLRRLSKPKPFEESDFEVPSVGAAPKRRRKSSAAASAGHDSEREEKSGEEAIDDVISGVAAGAGPVFKPKDWEGKGSSSENEGGRKKSKKEEKRAPISDDHDDEKDFELEIHRLGNGGPGRKENVCLLCEQPGELINCEGPCLGSYHPKCLGLTVIPTDPFKCDECLSGTHTCFVCKKSETNVRKCSVAHCGRFYHEECVRRFRNARVEDSRITCPLHVCATCTADNPKNPKASKGRLYRCVRCPTSYHIGDYCIAAGSMHLAGFNIVCSRHFQPVKTQSHHSHINVSWCFMCSKGGTLLCCESCPAAFHAECMEIKPPDDSEAWYCPSCSSGRKPLYGNIVWVKLGNYRWWPGQICHPRNVPLNIQEKPHQVGEFPVCFFGSNDYFWTHQGRVFLFQDGDKGSKDSAGAKGLVKIYQKAVREAVKAFELWSKAASEKEQLEIEKSAKKPPPYKHIKSNLPVGNVQVYKANISEITRCECKPEAENPCSHDSDCYNRLLMYECHLQVCPAGEKCQNQRFQRREYPPTETFKTEMSGWGLKTSVDIKKHDFVHEYVGELIDEDECHKRLEQAHEESINNYYMLNIDKNRIIDAGPKGNLSRFMNHCCDPNCETQKWTVGGDIRVGLFAKMDIPAGTELTFNYNLDCLGNEKKACYCGAQNCSGFLGARPKNSNGNGENKKEKKKKKKRKPKPDIKKEHEDFCYRCGEGGALVMCDKSGCPKAYHVQCLNLAKPPHGKWTCPWHHCDECGKLATKLCNECPNSYCHTHCPDNIFDVGNGNLICTDHEETLLAIESSRRESGAPGIKPLIDDGKSATPSECTMSSRASSPASSETDSLSGSKSSESGRLRIIESGSSAPASARSTPRHEPELAGKIKPRRRSSKTDSLLHTAQENASVSKADCGSGNKVKKGKAGRKSSGDKPARSSLDSKPQAAKRQSTERGKKRGRKPKASLDNAKNSTKKSDAKGKSSSKTVENNNLVSVGGSPMFDDTDDETYGNLVIDIPTV